MMNTSFLTFLSIHRDCNTLHYTSYRYLNLNMYHLLALSSSLSLTVFTQDTIQVLLKAKQG